MKRWSSGKNVIFFHGAMGGGGWGAVCVCVGGGGSGGLAPHYYQPPAPPSAESLPLQTKSNSHLFWSISQTHWAVADHPMGLWWPCQLFMFALTFTGFLNVKARHIDMSVWELSLHICLGLGGAIGITFPLFLFRYFGSLLPSDKPRPRYRLPTWGFEVLGIFLWLAYWSVASLPLVDSSEFVFYLWLTCTFLVLPTFIPANPLKASNEQAMMLPLYLGLVVLNAGLHWFLSYRALPDSTPKLNLFTTSSNPQDGIFVDCFFSFIVCCIYIAFTFSNPSSLVILFLFMLSTPLMSLGASFAAVLGYEVYLLKSPVDTNSNKMQQ